MSLSASAEEALSSLEALSAPGAPAPAPGALDAVLREARASPGLCARLLPLLAPLVSHRRRGVRRLLARLAEPVLLAVPPDPAVGMLLPVLVDLMGDDDAGVARAAAVSMANVYGRAVEHVARAGEAAKGRLWEAMDGVRAQSVWLALHHQHDGVRSVAVRVVEAVVMAVALPGVDNEAAVGRDAAAGGAAPVRVPHGHPVLDTETEHSKNAAAVTQLSDAMRAGRMSAANLTAAIGCLTRVLQRRPEPRLINTVVPLLVALHSNPPRRLADKPTRLESLRACLRRALMQVLRTPATIEHRETVTRALDEMGCRVEVALLLNELNKADSSAKRRDTPEWQAFQARVSQIKAVPDMTTPPMRALIARLAALPPAHKASLVLSCMRNFPQPPAGDRPLSAIFLEFMANFTRADESAPEYDPRLGGSRPTAAGAASTAAAAAATAAAGPARLTSVPPVPVPELGPEERAELAVGAFARVLSDDAEEAAETAGRSGTRAALVARLAGVARGGHETVLEHVTGSLERAVRYSLAVQWLHVLALHTGGDDDEADDAADRERAEAAARAAEEAKAAARRAAEAEAEAMLARAKAARDKALAEAAAAAGGGGGEGEEGGGEDVDAEMGDAAGTKEAKAGDGGGGGGGGGGDGGMEVDQDEDDAAAAPAGQEEAEEDDPRPVTYASAVRAVMRAAAAHDGVFTRLLVDLPRLTPAVRLEVERMCGSEDASEVRSALRGLADLAVLRPAERQFAFRLLLAGTTSERKELRGPAVSLATNRLYDGGSVLRGRVLEDARRSLARVLEPWPDLDPAQWLDTLPPPPTAEELVSMDEVQRGIVTGRRRAAEAEAARPVREADQAAHDLFVRRHMDLYLALCTRDGELLPALADTYRDGSPFVRTMVLSVAPPLVRTVGLSDDLLRICAAPPEGCEPFVLMTLYSLVEGGATPDARVVDAALAACKASGERQDVRLLVPVLGGLKPKVALATLARVVGMRNKTLTEEALLRLLRTRPQPVRPIDVLDALHTEEGTRAEQEAIHACLTNERDSFPSQVLTRCLERLCARKRLPRLLMVTMIKVLATDPKQANWALHQLERLLPRRPWEDENLWTGFAVVCVKTRPASCSLIAKLGVEQIRSLFEASFARDKERRLFKAMDAWANDRFRRGAVRKDIHKLLKDMGGKGGSR